MKFDFPRATEGSSPRETWDVYRNSYGYKYVRFLSKDANQTKQEWRASVTWIMDCSRLGRGHSLLHLSLPRYFLDKIWIIRVPDRTSVSIKRSLTTAPTLCHHNVVYSRLRQQPARRREPPGSSYSTIRSTVKFSSNRRPRARFAVVAPQPLIKHP